MWNDPIDVVFINTENTKDTGIDRGKYLDIPRMGETIENGEDKWLVVDIRTNYKLGVKEIYVAKKSLI
jgi:hypothetical protein